MRNKKKLGPRVLRKERDISWNFGAINDLKWSGTSGFSYTTAPGYSLTIPNQDWCMSQYLREQARRTASIVSSCPLMGREVLVTSVGRSSSLNDCMHQKTQALGLPYLIAFENYNQAIKMNLLPYYRSGVLSVRTDVGDIAKNAGHGRVGMDQLFSARAFWSMRPKFEGDVSIVNSIFELKDFKDVLNISRQLKQLGRASSVIREFSSYKAAARISAKESTSFLQGLARDTTGTAANAWLTYTLAVMPTIKDVLAITAQLLQDVSEEQKKFQEYGELGSTSHFSEADQTRSVIRGTGNLYPFPTGLIISQKTTATMRMKYSYIMRNRNEALRKFWGLTGTAEQLWNMVSLGFVLDYFLGLGKALSYMDWDENVTNLETEYCESLKTVVTSGSHIAQSPRTPALIIDGKYIKPISGERYHLVSGYQGTFYERKVMEPYKGPALPKFKRPSSKQAGTMLALARCFIS